MLANPFRYNTNMVHPVLALLQTEMRRFHRTPDLSFLERKEFQLVFIPDEMQLGFPQHEIIAGHCHQRGAGFTAHLFTAGHTRNPIRFVPLIKTFSTSPLGRIHGQLFAVRPYRFPDMDEYKQNRTQFMRIRVPIIFPFREKSKPDPNLLDSTALFGQSEPQVLSETKYVKVRAWMYIGMPQFWNDIISDYSFKFSNLITPRVMKLGEYFRFSKLDYGDSSST